MDEATSTKLSLDEGPLWKYVTKLEKPARSTSKSGGNTHFRCNYCNGPFMGSYSRVKAHLLKMYCNRIMDQKYRYAKEETFLVEYQQCI